MKTKRTLYTPALNKESKRKLYLHLSTVLGALDLGYHLEVTAFFLFSQVEVPLMSLKLYHFIPFNFFSIKYTPCFTITIDFFSHADWSRAMVNGNRELTIESFSGRRRPDWQSKPGTEVALKDEEEICLHITS